MTDGLFLSNSPSSRIESLKILKTWGKDRYIYNLMIIFSSYVCQCKKRFSIITSLDDVLSKFGM